MIGSSAAGLLLKPGGLSCGCCDGGMDPPEDCDGNVFFNHPCLNEGSVNPNANRIESDAGAWRITYTVDLRMEIETRVRSQVRPFDPQPTTGERNSTTIATAQGTWSWIGAIFPFTLIYDRFDPANFTGSVVVSTQQDISGTQAGLSRAISGTRSWGATIPAFDLLNNTEADITGFGPVARVGNSWGLFTPVQIGDYDPFRIRNTLVSSGDSPNGGEVPANSSQDGCDRIWQRNPDPDLTVITPFRNTVTTFSNGYRSDWVGQDLLDEPPPQTPNVSDSWIRRLVTVSGFESATFEILGRCERSSGGSAAPGPGSVSKFADGLRGVSPEEAAAEVRRRGCCDPVE